MLKFGEHFPLKGLLTLVLAALALSVACGGGGPEELAIPVTLRGGDDDTGDYSSGP